jgi:acyl dehydratase
MSGFIAASKRPAAPLTTPARGHGVAMPPIAWFDDLAPGQRFVSLTRTVTEAEIIAFAGEFDPQPFHLDPAAAGDSIFRGLAASGWHTTALSMRLVLGGAFRPAGGVIGSTADSLVWPRPVRPGDVLRVETEVLETRPSASRPTHGWVKIRNTTLNQQDQPVQLLVVTLLVRRRD